MAIKATEISDLIKQRIENFKSVTEARNVGTIVSVGEKGLEYGACFGVYALMRVRIDPRRFRLLRGRC